MFAAMVGVGILVLIVMSIFKILKEYERGVIFFLGRFQKVKGPGIIIVVPLIQTNDSRRPARHRDGRADAGRDFQGQRVRQSECGRVLPHRRPGERQSFRSPTYSKRRVSWRKLPCDPYSVSMNSTRCCRNATS